MFRLQLLLFFLSSMLVFSSQFYRASNAIIAPQLCQDLSLTSETLGMLSASFFYAFAATQIPIALLLDRLGARLIMTMLTLAGALGSCLFGISEGFYGALAGRMLLGFGMAGNFMGGMKLFTRWFPPREFATMSGLMLGIGTLGSIGSSTPLALLVAEIGWRSSFIAIGIATAVLAILFFLTIRDDPYTETDGKSSSGNSPTIDVSASLKLLLLNRDYWLISFGTFFRYGTLMAIQGLWAGPYLMECFRLSPVQAGNLLVLTTLGYVGGCSIGGWLSDRILGSPKYVTVLGLIGMAATELCFVYSWGQNDSMFRAGIFFSLGFFSGLGNVMYAHIKAVMPSEMSGMALTGINFFTMLGVGAYIHIMGWILEHFSGGMASGPESYGSAFFIAFAGVAVAACLYCFTRDPKNERKKITSPAVE